MTGIGPEAWAKDYKLARLGLVLSLQRASRLRKLLCRPTQLVDDDIREVLAANRLPGLEVKFEKLPGGKTVYFI